MNKTPRRRRTPLFEVRHSPIHGYGVFAARRIRKGAVIIEYLGDRVSHEQADERYQDRNPNDNHTFLFTVDARTVIDAGVDGNDARYINHACDPNCESTTVNNRVFIQAIRTIRPGEELSYDYQIQRDRDDASNILPLRRGGLPRHHAGRGQESTQAGPPRADSRRGSTRRGPQEGAAARRHRSTLATAQLTLAPPLAENS